MEREIGIVNKTGRPSIDLTEIHGGILGEDTLLHPTLDSLRKSYENNMAVALLDNERVIGFVRFTSLLDKSIKDKLGLESSIPDIWEIGSAIIIKDPQYRGRGFYPRLRSSLFKDSNR